MSAPTRIEPVTAARLLAEGEARLIDIREPDEHARERIPGARNLPLSQLEREPPLDPGGGLAILHCRSGARTTADAARLAAAVRGEWAILEGGLDGWKAAGLATEIDHRRPIEVMRQVQITAGTLVLLGVGLGALVSPWFLLLAGFVGTGLVFAGLSGWCGMARLLALAPWNRVPEPSSLRPRTA